MIEQERNEGPARREVRWLLENRIQMSAINIDLLLDRFAHEARSAKATTWEKYDGMSPLEQREADGDR